MAKKIAIENQKGGVGKTEITRELAAAFVDLGFKVLVFDLDPQGDLTEASGLGDVYIGEDETMPSLFKALLSEKYVTPNGKKRVKLADIIKRPPNENFDIIPATYMMGTIEKRLYVTPNREHRLKRLLGEVEDRYDWILFDCPPALGNMTDNALNAARKVIIPVHAKPAAIRAIELLLDQIESLEEGLDIEVEPILIVPNEVRDTEQQQRISKELRDTFSDLVTPFDIRQRQVLSDAWENGYTIFSYDPPAGKRSRLQAKAELVELYRKLATIVMERTNGGGNDE